MVKLCGYLAQAEAAEHMTRGIEIEQALDLASCVLASCVPEHVLSRWPMARIDRRIRPLPQRPNTSASRPAYEVPGYSLAETLRIV